ncbi:MAG: S41 family peptidase [Prolixibacteraceae bacterium]|nr:S41 family peptidase [Prolixibacteraceae bacterium]
MRNTLKIIYPIILALAVAGGILLGLNLNVQKAPVKNSASNIFQPDKLSLVLRLIERDYVDSIDKTEMVNNVIPEVLEELDPHSTYIEPREMKAVSEEMRGNFSGIGVQFVMQEDTVMIVDVVSGGPSQKLGIMSGDRIVKVEERSIAGEDLPSDSIVSMLRGKEGTIVNVSIFRPGYDDLLEFEIERGEIPLYSVDASYMATDKIGLIKVNRFAESTYNEFMEALNSLSLKGAQKLIIDLRGNAGGSLQTVIQMVDEFLPKDRLIVYTEGKSRARQNYYSSERGAWKDKDVAVLIDEFSASASEIFAGAIQDNDRGLVIGRRSFGKGLVQEQIPFFDGSALRLTVARFYTPSGRSIQKPYENSNDEYYKDFQRRVEHDELVKADSIHFNDSLQYKTVGGRTVYGGGGIMPDFFVPVDTSGINKLFSAIASKNLVYHFAFDYADQYRNNLNTLENPDELMNYLESEDLFKQFLAHVKKEGITYTNKQLSEAEELLKMQLFAYVSRNIFGDNGFYPIFFKIDKTVKKTIDLLQQDWQPKKVATLG